jgi:UPF0271 protein
MTLEDRRNLASNTARVVVAPIGDTSAFADRAYTARGTLVSRRQPDAVLHDPAQVAERVVRMVTRREVEAVDGTVVALEAATVCVHGDSPGAVAMARAVREALARAGVDVTSFAATARA